MGELFAGRYELLDPVATGGMGTIWRVLDHADGQVRAAKILRQSDAASLLRFVREQSMRIDHHHVVTPLSWAAVDDRVLFTMPLVRGGSVADLLRGHGSVPVRWAAALLGQVLQGLEAVHAAGVVHRDVKPANLLLDPSDPVRPDVPHLRLTDFGIAAPLDEPRMTRGSMAIGTPGYMAPEQWWGAEPDPRADLYAAARVALEMLTGARPAAAPPDGGPVPDVAVDGLRTGEAARDRLLDVLADALRTDPAARPASAAVMRERLGATGLLGLPPQPETEPLVPDRFAGAPPPPRVGSSPMPPPPPYAPPIAPAGTPNPPTSVLAAALPSSRPSAVPGLLLVLLGLALLAVAGALLL